MSIYTSAEETRICKDCSVAKNITEFVKHKTSRGGHTHRCKVCSRQVGKQYYADNKDDLNAKTREYYKTHPETKQVKRVYREKLKDERPEYVMWMRAKHRSTQRNQEFTIDITDIVIPTICPILGITLVANKRQMDNSPSLDRIDSTLGYVPGNVIVISWRANRLKNNATIEELEKICDFYRKL